MKGGTEEKIEKRKGEVRQEMQMWGKTLAVMVFPDAVMVFPDASAPVS